MKPRMYKGNNFKFLHFFGAAMKDGNWPRNKQRIREKHILQKYKRNYI